ncbi:hypothetical protein MPC4_80041 [Methylocella tundrae]|uniref:Uncharacterized protein n=1 Tax=Methylocella tundrae TaxID=227605 RepID=A0A8B6MBK5_METTU|nr:hypothetical protein MPC1_1670006 [Methylocella tundrae]VTZ52370.1 hypothetical protein MPC4_80041 [Methylocella tundrae]
MGGAAPLGLDDGLGVACDRLSLDFDCAVSWRDDHDDTVGFGFNDSRKDMAHHGPSRDLMQSFGPRGAHARSIAGGKNDGEASPAWKACGGVSVRSKSHEANVPWDTTATLRCDPSNAFLVF